MPVAPSRSPDRWRQVEDLFHAASELPSDHRSAFLEEACGSDRELLTDVQALLAGIESSGAFLEAAIGSAAQIVLEQEGQQSIPPGACFNQYRIIRPLGAGGMGRVHLADDTRLKRQVAVKVLAPALTLDPSALRRFQLEAQALSSSNHPNLLTVFDFCESGGKHLLVTEYVNGRTLRELISSGPLAPTDALDIAVQIAAGLSAAHLAGVVHRDIKPENIIVRADGCVKILDFGIAKLGEPQGSSRVNTSDLLHSTLSGSLFGTPRYMSPEQARGLPVDARTDLFSCGAVLYEMLTAAPAFNGKTQSDTIADILRGTPKPFSLGGAAPAKKLVALVARSLEKERESRYHSASELLNDLTEVRDQYRPQKRRAHAKWLWALAVLVTVQLGVLLWMSLRPVTPIPSHRPRTLAVLPFRNLEPQSESDFLGYSLADQVIARLAYVKALTVRPASSVRRFQDGAQNLPKVAAALNSELLLTGTYRKQGDHLLITAKLLSFRPEKTIWQRTLDLSYKDLTSVDDRLTKTVISALTLQLGPEEAKHLRTEPKIDPLAYEYFLRGVDLYAASNFEGAIQMLEKAAGLEPSYAPIWAHLGRAYTTHASLQFGGRDDYRRAESAYQKAIAADPFLPEPRVYMANLFTDTGRVEEAIPLLTVALDSSPNNAEAHWELSYALRFGGMLHESIVELETARRLDPEVKLTSATPNSYLYLGYYSKFLLSLPANDSALLVFYQGLANYYLNNRSEALIDFDRGFDLAPDLIQAQIGKAISDGMNGHADVGLKRLSETVEKMRERGVTDPEAVYKIAQAYSILGDKTNATSSLSRSIAGGFFPYDYIVHDPLLSSLHDSSAFSGLMTRARDRQEQFRRRFSTVLPVEEDTNSNTPRSETGAQPSK